MFVFGIHVRRNCSALWIWSYWNREKKCCKITNKWKKDKITGAIVLYHTQFTCNHKWPLAVAFFLYVLKVVETMDYTICKFNTHSHSHVHLLNLEYSQNDGKWYGVVRKTNFLYKFIKVHRLTDMVGKMLLVLGARPYFN